MEKYQLNVVSNDNGAIEQLIFSGEMVLDNMEPLLKEMSELKLEGSGDLSISLQNVVDLDLSFLQLFKSFLLFLDRKQLSVNVEWPEDKSLMQLLGRSGFSKVFELK